MQGHVGFAPILEFREWLVIDIGWMRGPLCDGAEEAAERSWSFRAGAV